MKEHKQAVRIQTSFLSQTEKKALVYMAKRMPKKINSDHLTIIGFAGALMSGAGYVLANLNINYLWLASFGLLLNWFGDSLDGTLARVRNLQRPQYGFFIDHNIDALTVLVIGIGAGLSPLMSFPVAMLILSGYFLLSIFTYINSYLLGEFKISYMKFGPTEFRIIVILINTLFIYAPVKNQVYHFRGISFGVMDVAGLAIAVVLFIIYIVSFFVYKKKYEKTDPFHPYNPEI